MRHVAIIAVGLLTSGCLSSNSLLGLLPPGSVALMYQAPEKSAVSVSDMLAGIVSSSKEGQSQKEPARPVCHPHFISFENPNLSLEDLNALEALLARKADAGWSHITIQRDKGEGVEAFENLQTAVQIARFIETDFDDVRLETAALKKEAIKLNAHCPTRLADQTGGAS